MRGRRAGSIAAWAVAAGLSAGCGAGGGEEAGGCDWLVTEVGLDTSFGTIEYEDLGSFELTPRAIVERFEQPVEGELRWRGDNDWFTMGPAAGTTRFRARTRLSGPVWWVRVEDATPPKAAQCAASLVFEVTYEIRTEDGWFDEAWPLRTRYELVGLGGMSAFDFDPGELEVPEALEIEPRPDPPRPYGNMRYGGILNAVFYPNHPIVTLTTSVGSIYYRGDFANPQTGEVMEGGGINALVAEWGGTSESAEPPVVAGPP